MTKKYKILFLDILLITIVFLICNFIEYKLPGLYMDAVNPDYFAAKGKYSSINPVIMLPYILYPILGNWYHGTLTLFFGLPFYRIFGTNIFSLRLFNFFIGLCILVLVYSIIDNIIRNRKISFISTFILATNFVFIMSFRIQYYIILFGMIPLLISVLYFLKYMDAKVFNMKYLVISGFFAGLAFYNYFIFIFFMISYIFKLLKSKNINSIITWIISFIFGSFPYIIGYIFLVIIKYYDSILKFKNLILLIPILIFLILIYILYLIKNKKNLKKIYTILGISFLIAIIITSILFYIKRDNLLEIVEKLNIFGNNTTSLYTKIKMLILFFKNALMGYGVEGMIFKSTNLKWQEVIRNIIFVILFLNFLFNIKNIQVQKLEKIKFILSLPISFFLIAIIFANRLGNHHFSVMLPLYYIILGCTLESLVKNKINKNFIKILTLIIIIINIITASEIILKLKQTGGEKMCSEQINILAENALLENDEYSYIFEEWGFLMPFKFLTSDNVRYYLECNINVLKDISDNNKKAKICFWDKKNQEYYLNIIKQSNMKVDNIITLYSRDKQEVFYIIECS